MGKRRATQLIASGLLSTLIIGAGATSAVAQCMVDQLSVRGDFGTALFNVDVADDNDERAQGLMFVEEMATTTGMLFVYERPQRVSFWMRNTLIPLDMIFLDETGVVRRIHPNAVPLDETTIFGGDAIQFVLEINGGLSARLGIEEGDEMQHPAFGTDAAWPCP